MMRIDEALAQLSAEAVPDQLAAVNEKVLEKLAGHRVTAPRESYRIRVGLITLALGAGIAGGMAPEAYAERHQSYSTLTEIGTLAPSELLVGG